MPSASRESAIKIARFIIFLNIYEHLCCLNYSNSMLYCLDKAGISCAHLCYFSTSHGRP